MAFLSRILVLCIVVVVVVFAVSNDTLTRFTLWPFESAIVVPLYLPTLLALLIGVLFGGMIVGVRLIKARFLLRRAHNTIKRLEKNTKSITVEASTQLSPTTPLQEMQTKQQPTIGDGSR